MKKTVAIIAALGMAQITLYAADWLQQGGPNKDFVVPKQTSGPLADSFPDQKPPLLWKTSVGQGTAPVVVSEGKVYTFGLYKAGTTPTKLADPASMPDGRISNIFWIRGATEKAAKVLADAGKKAAEDVLNELSNLLVRDGKVYGFDAHGCWDGQYEAFAKTAGMKKENGWPRGGEILRALRPEGMGRFQCRDVETGKLLSSSDAIPTRRTAHDGGEWHGTHSLLAGDLLVACGESKFDVAKIGDNTLELLATVEQSRPYNNWNSDKDYGDPVLVDGRLYIRRQATYEENLRCYDLRPGK